MSATTASGVSAQRSLGELAVKRETCLSKTKVLLDIPDTATKEVYKKLVVDMGGEVTKSSTAHVAVATSFTKQPIRLAKVQGTPVVRPTWLKECYSKGFQVPFTEFLLPPLGGLYVSSTGFSQEQRQRIQHMCTQLGGASSNDLTYRCTHLLVADGALGTPKYIKVKHEWLHIKAVSRQWLEECHSRQCYHDEGPFEVAASMQHQLGRAMVAHAAAGQPDSSLVLGGQQQQQAHTSSTVLWGSLVSGATTHAPAAGAGGAAGPSAELEQQPAGAMGAAPWPCAAPAAPGLRPASLALAAVESTVLPGPDAEEEEEEDFLFLDHVAAHLVGCSEDETRASLQAVREGAATREPELVPAVTHIVVGSCATPVQVQAVRDHARQHRDLVQVVTPAWLQLCRAHRQCLPPDSSCTFNLPPPPMAGATGMTSTATAAAAKMLDTSSRSNSELAAPGTLRLQEPELTPHPFKGLWFILVGGKDDNEDYGKEERQIRECIKMGGGTFFDASTSKMVDPQLAFAVCPPGMAPARAEEIERQRPEFKLVPVAHRVTFFWLESCLSHSCRMPLVRNLVIQRPLPYQVPSKAFAAVRLAISQIIPEDRQLLQRIIKILGGSFVPKISAKGRAANISHLVLMKAEGDKFRFAVRHGVTVVNDMWLVESALAGRPLPSDRYQPEETEETAAIVAAARNEPSSSSLATQHLAASQATQQPSSKGRQTSSGHTVQLRQQQVAPAPGAAPAAGSLSDRLARLQSRMQAAKAAARPGDGATQWVQRSMQELDAQQQHGAADGGRTCSQAADQQRGSGSSGMASAAAPAGQQQGLVQGTAQPSGGRGSAGSTAAGTAAEAANADARQQPPPPQQQQQQQQQPASMLERLMASIDTDSPVPAPPAAEPAPAAPAPRPEQQQQLQQAAAGRRPAPGQGGASAGAAPARRLGLQSPLAILQEQESKCGVDAAAQPASAPAAAREAADGAPMPEGDGADIGSDPTDHQLTTIEALLSGLAGAGPPEAPPSQEMLPPAAAHSLSGNPSRNSSGAGASLLASRSAASGRAADGVTQPLLSGRRGAKRQRPDTPPAERRSGRLARGLHTREQPDPGVLEMSQQVGYDAGLQPTERLRTRAAAASAAAGGRAKR